MRSFKGTSAVVDVSPLKKYGIASLSPLAIAPPRLSAITASKHSVPGMPSHNRFKVGVVRPLLVHAINVTTPVLRLCGLAPPQHPHSCQTRDDQGQSGGQWDRSKTATDGGVANQIVTVDQIGQECNAATRL